MDRRILIISNLYNCEKYVEKHIKSILKQSYSNWNLILINDGCTDNTDRAVRNYMPKLPKIEYVVNESQKGMALNVYKNVLKYTSDENTDDIIYIMNGADWLPHENVFKQLNELYEKGCLATCGGSMLSNKKRYFYNYFYDDIINKMYRKDGEFYSPVTFNAMLFYKLKTYDLFKNDYSSIGCYKEAIEYSIIDMVPKESISFIKNEPIYVFNVEYNKREKCDKVAREYYKSLSFNEINVEHDNIDEEEIPEGDNVHFIVFASGYNCEKWINKHIDSILSQTYKNFTYIIVDDQTTDGTYKKICEYKDERIKVYRPLVNQKWCKNAWDYLRPNIVNDEDVVVVVDLDDWLSHDTVLEKLNKIYKKEHCWVTYGSHTRVSTERARTNPVSQIILDNKLYRNTDWEYSHLKTFKAFLYLNIEEKDFKSSDGEWLLHTYDKALMFPILEMSPADKIKHIKEILYVYNNENPLNVGKVNRKDGKKTYGVWLREQPVYPELVRE